MQNFIFHNTTKIIFGKDAENNTAKEIKNIYAKKVFIVYGSKSVKENGLLEKIENILKNENIEYYSFGGVRANPSLEHALEAAKKAIDFNTDFVLAIGGGSVIDTAKAIAHAAANKDIYVWDFFTNKQILSKSIPIGCILTISASGSEMSDAAVLTNKTDSEKRILHSDFNKPAFAIMNPYFTMTLPYYQIACGIVDMMMHTLDRYFGYSDSSNETTDSIAEAILRTIIKNGEYFLLAFTHFDKDNRAFLEINDFTSCLMNMWNECDIHYGGNTVVLPLLGSGITRFRGYENITDQELLEIIIWTFKVSRIRFQYPAKAKIVLTNDCLDKISLYDIKKRFEA